MTFEVRRYQFEFQAVDRIVFPPAKAGNTLRGALGDVFRKEDDNPFRRRLVNGPSGLVDPPRPFVLRAWHLDGKTFQPGERFGIGVHDFDIAKPMGAMFAQAFGALARVGFGSGRGKVELLPVETTGEVETLRLEAAGNPQWARVRFVTPTELKGEAGEGEIPFGVLFARVRDRIATLSRLYGREPVEADFAGLGERAREIRTVHSSLRAEEVTRRSSRTAQKHGIGGFTGTVEYAGDLGEFLPWLRAAWWTGVGRHTVWGNGVMEIDAGE